MTMDFSSYIQTNLFTLQTSQVEYEALLCGETDIDLFDTWNWGENGFHPEKKNQNQSSVPNYFYIFK